MSDWMGGRTGDGHELTSSADARVPSPSPVPIPPLSGTSYSCSFDFSSPGFQSRKTMNKMDHHKDC